MQDLFRCSALRSTHMIVVLMTIGFFAALPVEAQVTLSNLTHPSNRNLQIGDTWEISIPNARGGTYVDVAVYRNGSYLGTVPEGNSNPGGGYTLQGSDTNPSDEGAWQELWFVGGTWVGTVSFFLGSNVAPVIHGPDGIQTSLAFWYLGGAPSIDGFYVTESLTLVTNNSDNQRTITWGVDRSDLLSIGGPVNTTTPILTATGSSGFNAGYNIHVTATVDGVQSASFAIFIDTPYTVTTSDRGQWCSAPGVCDCAARGLPGQFGYANYFAHGISDLLGYTMVPITTNESLENLKKLNATYNAGTPSQSTWTTDKWNADNSFFDTYSYCARAQGVPH